MNQPAEIALQEWLREAEAIPASRTMRTVDDRLAQTIRALFLERKRNAELEASVAALRSELELAYAELNKERAEDTV